MQQHLETVLEPFDMCERIQLTHGVLAKDLIAPIKSVRQPYTVPAASLGHFRSLCVIEISIPSRRERRPMLIYQIACGMS